MFGSLDVLPKGLNLTLDEEDELVKSVVNFLGHRRRDKFAFPLLITLYSFIFATGLTGNLCTYSFCTDLFSNLLLFFFHRYVFHNLEKS